MGLLDTSSGDFVTWDDVGDNVVGSIARFFMADGTKFDPNPALAVSIEQDDGETVAVALRIVDLRVKCAEIFGNPDSLDDLAPFIGDRIAIEFTAREKLPNGNTAKMFTVEHKSGETAAAEKPKSLLG